MNAATRKSKASPLVIALVATMAMLVAYLVFAFITGTDKTGSQARNISTAKELSTLVATLPPLAARASEGDESAFTELENLRSGVNNKRNALHAGLASGNNQGVLGGFGKAWEAVDQHLARLLISENAAVALGQLSAQLEANHAELQTHLTAVIEHVLASRSTTRQAALAQAQLWRLERIRAALRPGREMIDPELLVRDVELFNRVVTGFKDGDAELGLTRLGLSNIQASLTRVEQLFSGIAEGIQPLRSSRDAVMALPGESASLMAAAPALIRESVGLVDSIRVLEQKDGAYGSPEITVYVGIFLLIGLTLLGLIFYLGTRSRLQESAEANRVNQDAILRLLDEIEGLGEGDLTAQVTVTEGFTGAIADAINLTIAQLRELVSRIVDTAAKVSASANSTRSTVAQLTELSEQQAEEIAGASAAINEMATTIDQVSANAAESAAVAHRSVSIANKGAVVVRSTIAGMDNIRGQIQDTAKRIKRLGESSQEIGDIVSLINDIADQTNILSLNAAIQASMAGDAGRGFAVVADEVQRLAERSANATKQIAALVKTIQTDTYEAVSSMEQTTAEVVAGASLTEDAGIALSEIETVSTNLAELIQDISTAARHQATTAGHISKTMNVIQDITSKTLEGTSRTASSVDELAEMAIEQRESVSGFKLPEQSLSGLLRPELYISPEPPERKDGAIKSRSRVGSQIADGGGSKNPFKPPASQSPPADRQLPGGAENIEETEEIEEFIPVRKAPAHVQQVLAENSAVMDEMDYLSEMDDIDEMDEDLASLEEAPATVKRTFAAGLEAELASIDLDEFDLEPELKAKEVS